MACKKCGGLNFYIRRVAPRLEVSTCQTCRATIDIPIKFINETGAFSILCGDKCKYPDDRYIKIYETESVI